MTEFDILLVLAVRAGGVVRKEESLDRVWRHDFDAGSNVVESHICTLRRKLADTRRTLISTVRGIGYRLTAPDTASGQPSYGTGLGSAPVGQVGDFGGGFRVDERVIG